MGRQDAARPVEVSHALNRFTQGALPSFFGKEAGPVETTDHREGE